MTPKPYVTRTANIPLMLKEAVEVSAALLMYIDHQQNLASEACDAQDFDKARNHRDICERVLAIMTRINKHF